MKQVAAAVLLNPKKQILLQLRDNKPGIAYPNYWGLIGGSMEAGESELQAVKREIFEEINLNIEPIKKIGLICIKRKDIINNVFLGRLDIEAEKIKIGEGQCVKFFDFEEIKNLKIPSPLRKFLNENQKEIFGFD